MGRNVVKLTLFLATLSVLFVLIGQAVGGTGGMIVATLFALMLNGGAYWFSDRLVLRMAGARALEGDELRWLQDLVVQMARRAHLPVPRVYIVESDTPNAFATGRSPRHGVVVVTTGITRLLTRDELAGVIAHELAHIKHRDTLLSAVVASLAGAIAMIANIGQWTLIFGGAGDDEEGAGLVGGLVWIFVAPIAATLIQLGISRAREFQADARGAEILGDPLPLASALEKLEWAAGRVPLHASPATASLYIVNPFNGSSLLRLFSTHPRSEDRIARLRALALRAPEPAGRRLAV